MDKETTSNYAELPGELLAELLGNVDSVAEKASSILNIDDTKIHPIAERLRENGLIQSIGNEEMSLNSVMAVDGGSVFERLTAADLLVAAAVGVEGVHVGESSTWSGKNQYHAWSGVLSHEEYNTRLLQGIMHLMEMIILGESDYDIMIMDGSHLTPIIKINSLLSANEEGAGKEYSEELRGFLKTKFDKVMPDMPDILKNIFTDKRIISITKYSSSKDFLEGVAHEMEGIEDILLDDKAFFSVILKENEYTTPQSFGQSKDEREKRWDKVHIGCSLEIPEKGILNDEFERILKPVSTKDGNKSSLYYLYFKPVGKLAYRIEIKKELAEDKEELKKVLYNIKKQIAFPFIIEPVPQFIADSMAKQVGTATHSIKEAIRHSKKFTISKNHLHLFTSYRS